MGGVTSQMDRRSYANRFQMGAFGKIWKGVATAGAGVAALAAVNASIRRNARQPDDYVFGGEAALYDWRHGRIFYKAGGKENSGAPVVLIHGIGAGVSSFTWRKNFDELSKSFRIYAVDLLGFGLSDKPAVAPYSSDLYVELIADFIDDVTGSPANIVASSLGGAFAIRVADEYPGLLKSLVLIAPTGSSNLRARPGVSNAAFYGLLQSPVLGTSFYNTITSERSIRDFARKQLFFDKRKVTDRFVAHHYASSHQPGAQHSVAAFLSGYMNTDTRAPFSRIRQEVTLVWGKQDEVNSLEHAAELLRLNPNVNLKIFDRCRMLPHEEHPERFNQLVQEVFHARSIAA